MPSRHPLLTDDDLRQREFPVCAQRAFLAHAAVCPLPRRVADAVATYAQQAAVDDQELPVLHSLVRRTRERAAQLVGGSAEEIALVGPTSIGLSTVAAGFPFQPGDNVVFYFDDYPSNVYPWMALAAQGVEARALTPAGLGRIEISDVLARLDGRTRLVALASCHFITGWRIDLEGISEELRRRGIAFCVDGIQTLGAFPTSSAHADFMAADSHKWLLGPCGAGFLHVGQEWLDRLQPRTFGWHNVRCPDFVARETLAFRTGASRYEAGSHSMLGLCGLDAALGLILEVGVEAISAELLRKRALLVEGCLARGWNVVGADAPPQHQSGMVSITRTETDLPALHQRLAAAGVVCSLRTDRAGNRYLRFSPHFYNPDADLHRALELL